ncbi:hypothetical protein CDN99_12045 [Roseateles aquatilis]|uniref:Peptidase S9 prolyl oligopeptidase catalytic domain-containing protein n=1 Tax=Roseateles aquatilis TaxID=431061 RepID=A0A246JE20_9BURK|nr:prolyl oligopeptidase family serine peptidase [Roseateles aquatilis]OWQ90885.1 hypothetical protein CDN99_12045 [Roseateles aquatilis]
MHKTHRAALAALTACALSVALIAPGVQAQPAPSRPAIEDFFRDPEMRRARLSPNGRFLAFVANKDNASMLAVAEIDNDMKVMAVASFADADIGSYAWVGNDRLVYTAVQDQGDKWRDLHSSGLWSVRRDGTERRQLIHTMWGANDQTASRISNRALTYDWSFRSAPDDDSGEVMVHNRRYDGRGQPTAVRLSRLNVVTQLRRGLDEGTPSDTRHQWLDPVGEPWALSAVSGARERLYLKNAEGAWTLWQQGGLFEYTNVTPFASDGRSLRLVLSVTPEGTTALYRIDPATLKLEARPLISTKGFDFDGDAVFDPETRQLLGVQFQTDAPTSYWFNAQLRQWQAFVDKALPGRVNLLDCGRCLRTGRLLVTSSSDRQPDQFLLFDTAKEKLTMLGSSRPWIKAAQMGQRDPMRIKARDGLEFPVMVTIPADKAEGPRPAVVLVHGGPYLRGTQWTWDEEAQFLASRGYVVIEPEFRGSTGYGDQLFKAGWKQWGLAMQDDISDSLRWAVKQGWVDPQRVCIAGASYGGYATLMGLIKDPGQYRCGVSWVGVTDIEYLSTISWSDMSDVWKDYGMTLMVGDREKDAEQLRKTSPLRRAAEIRQPLLLAYGHDDRRVPLKHGQDFRSALNAAGNKQFEYVTYAEEGHGWRKLATKVDFYGRMERFLARHIGTEPSKAIQTAPSESPADGAAGK